MTVRMIIGDTRDVTATIPDGSVDLVLTSPPFLALRSYLPDDHPDKAREIGSEPNPAAFIDMLLALTAEWRRVLAPHGTLAVELGDTYSGNNESGWDRLGVRADQADQPPNYRKAGTVATSGTPRRQGWPLAKSLALIPEAYRLALAYGINPLTGQPSPAGQWRVRNNVTWCRPNPPVGALGDKFRPSTSDLVIACTSDRRWFDLDAVRVPGASFDRAEGGANGSKKRGPDMATHDRGLGEGGRVLEHHPAGAPPLDHWIIPPGGYSGSHYAVFPPALLDKPIEACCPRRVCRTCGTPSRRLVDAELVPAANGGTRGGKAVAMGNTTTYEKTERQSTTTGWTSCECPGTDGIRLDGWHTGTGWRPGMVLDPFGGSGTTGLVAHGRSRDCTLIDLDDRNAELARERLGMFLEVTHHTEESVA